MDEAIHFFYTFLILFLYIFDCLLLYVTKKGVKKVYRIVHSETEPSVELLVTLKVAVSRSSVLTDKVLAESKEH